MEELNTAIENAEDGDTILFGTRLWISEDMVIGAADKTLVFKLNSEYNPNGFFYCDTWSCKNLSIKNIIFDGTRETGQMVAAVDCSLSLTGDKGIWNFENVVFENFKCSWAVIIAMNADTYFKECQFRNNLCSGLRVCSGFYAELYNCTISNNYTTFRGGAIQCDGKIKVENCVFTDNSAVNQESMQGEGGAIRTSYGSFCEIVSSRIAGNTADYGGDDIYSFGSCVDVEYTNGMESVYEENAPIGFYVDDYGNRFNSQTPTGIVGEIVSINSNQNGLFGLKFVFANDLPPEEDTESPTIPVVHPLRVI